ncbi:Uncharacterised protein [Klebsiella pneumoniae]|nr:Uncharacterised protein [Klebsiella pneumoniae]
MVLIRHLILSKIKLLQMVMSQHECYYLSKILHLAQFGFVLFLAELIRLSLPMVLLNEHIYGMLYR